MHIAQAVLFTFNWFEQEHKTALMCGNTCQCEKSDNCWEMLLATTHVKTEPTRGQRFFKFAVKSSFALLTIYGGYRILRNPIQRLSKIIAKWFHTSFLELILSCRTTGCFGLRLALINHQHFKLLGWQSFSFWNDTIPPISTVSSALLSEYRKVQRIYHPLYYSIINVQPQS